MRFDEDSQLDTSQVQDTRGRGGFGGFPRSGGVAIGGGAGMAPMLGLLRSMAERGVERPVTFDYGARTARDLDEAVAATARRGTAV